MRHLAIVPALLVFSMAACAFEDEPEAPAVSEETLELSGPVHTVYLNFDGGTYTDCDYCSLSASNRSWVVGTVFKKSSVTLAPAFAGNTARRNAILSYLRNIYAPYNLVFTTTRPASGNYTMAVFTRDDLRADIAGYSPIDCGQQSKQDIVFLWRAERAVGYATEVEKLAAHELGHSFGLEHVNLTSNTADDLMRKSGRDTATDFQISPLATDELPSKCDPGATIQDGPARLRAGVGPSNNPPPAPASLTGGPVADFQVWLTWPAVNDRNTAGYILKRNGAVVLWRDKSGGTSFVDDGLPESSWLSYELYTYSYAGVWSTGHAQLNTFTPAGGIHSTPLWRYWSHDLADHYYSVVRNDAGYAAYSFAFETQEGFAFGQQFNGTVPVYQYWSPGQGDHFYTTYWGELGGGGNGYNYEGVAFYVFPKQYYGSVPLYRYYNPTRGDHFYTTHSGTYSGWGYEGILGYVYNDGN